MTDSRAVIQNMADRLVELFQPSRIILFGSFARGEATDDSDVDLLVVVPEVEDRRMLRVRLRRALAGLVLPKDFVLLTDCEIEARKVVPGYVAYPADKEGRVL